MQTSIFDILQDDWNYSDKRVMIGLSGGINSMAVLCYLATVVEEKPKELYLFYAHFEEHSPDTEEFVQAGVEYAKKHFDSVIFEQTNNSILSFFRKSKMIPHPMVSPCTRILKIEPMVEFMVKHSIDVDLVGYVREERGRIERQISKGAKGKEYLISHLSNEDCFSIVKNQIGWYPKIYSLTWNAPGLWDYLSENKNVLGDSYETVEKYARRGYGHNGSARVFGHNNCLPCKNMQTWEYMILKFFYPSYFERAMKLAEQIGSHWGRDADAIKTIGEQATCAVCAFD